MPHGLNNDFLYSVCKINVKFSKENEGPEQIYGTGFFIQKDEELYLITNRHVVDLSFDDDSKEGYKIENLTLEISRFIEDSKSVECEEIEISSCHIEFPHEQLDDIACIYDIRLLKENGQLTLIPFNFLATTEVLEKDVFIGDQVQFIGFPELYDHHNNTPIVRGGIISSDPRLNYSPYEEFEGHIIAYEGYTTPGGSGSPVFATPIGFPVESNIISVPEGFYHPVLLIGINAGFYNGEETIIEIGNNVKTAEDSNITVNEYQENEEKEIYRHQYLSYMFKSQEIINLINKAENKLLQDRKE